MNAPLLIYLVAGEASGDALGAGLMRELRAQHPDIQFAGVGGEAMTREGLKSLFPYNELSIMGFLEVLPHIPKLLRRLREVAIDIVQKQPACVVTIDSPGFTFRLARALKNNPQTQHIKRIHYVAPSVWAYKPGRARKTAELFDALLTLLPFEPPYFEKEGLITTFVGHPVLWETPKGDGIGFRVRHRIANDTPLLLLLPGSRAGEVKHHLPLFIEAAKSLPDFTIAILANPQVQDIIRSTATPNMHVIDISEKHDAFAAATLALSKSGTVTLELAAAGVPTVVAHKTSALSAWLIRRMILISYYTLPNIAANKEIIPELMQERCAVPDMVQALTHYAKPHIAKEQREQCAAALLTLRGSNMQNPHSVAAAAVLRCLA